MEYNTLLDNEIKCTCGHNHYVPIKEVDFDFKIDDIADISNKFFSGKNILIIGDKHTHREINEIIINIMENSKYNISVIEFEDKKLIPDEKAIGTIIMGSPRNVSGIISIGSGTINDLNRLIGDRLRIPVVTIATAPSMDGYAAAGSSLMYKGSKKTIKGSTVSAIFGDINVIKECPFELIQAGFGDIIGKKTAIADWVLSKNINDEYWCDKTVDLVMDSTQLCINNANGIANRDKVSIKYLIEALILSGIAMSMVDDTRPASGGEHLVSHYMVMKAIEAGELPPSHGKTVAIGTLIVANLYEFLLKSNFKNKSEELIREINNYLPKPKEVIEWLEIIKLPTNPSEYGINKEFMKEIVLNAGFIRDRYTIFTLLHGENLLSSASEYILDKFYR